MVLITDRIPLFDFYLFVQEYLYADSNVPKVYIISPLVKSLNYYVKASGLFTSIFGETLPDQLRTEHLVEMLLRKNASSDIRIVTRLPTERKYERLFDVINELEFLISLVERGVRVYFFEHHKKYLLTNFGVVTGSANYTPSGRYLTPESTFFFDAGDPTYKECQEDIDALIKKADFKGEKTMAFLQENLREFKERVGKA
mgnify:CR=1 FL=1